MILHTNTPETPLAAQKLYLEYIRPTTWNKRPQWRLLSPLYFEGLTVPSGFVSDLGTIPRVFWAIFDPVNTYAAATIIHDYALSQNHERTHADRVFNRALLALNTGRFRRSVLFSSVRAFSGTKRLFQGKED